MWTQVANIGIAADGRYRYGHEDRRHRRADDSSASIVAAVEEGRAISSSIGKFLRYLPSANLGELRTRFFWRPGDPGVTNERPRTRGESAITGSCGSAASSWERVQAILGAGRKVGDEYG